MITHSMAVFGMSLAYLVFISDIYKGEDLSNNIVSILRYIYYGLGGYFSIKSIRRMVEAILNKVSLTRKIEELNFELDFEKELENETPKEDKGKSL